jgi:hypothetical protein
MRRNVLYLLLMMILFGGVLGCGKEDPAPVQGVNPLEERSKGMKDGSKDKSPMKPRGARPGGK